MSIKPILLAVILIATMIPYQAGASTGTALPSVSWSGYDLVIDEDLDLSGIVVWTNMTVLIDANLSVGGILSVVNSTVHLNGSRIDVRGYLNISDLDHDPLSVDDSSEVVDISGNGSTIKDIGDLYPETGSNIRNSLIDGIRFIDGYVTARDIICLNTTFSTSEPSLFRNLDMTGNGTSTAISDVVGGIDVRNISISSYETGMEISGSGIELDDLSIDNCSKALVISDVSGVLRNSQLMDNDLQIKASGPFDLFDCMIKGGEMQFQKDMETNILRSRVEDMQMIRNASIGSIIDNDLIRCERAIFGSVGSTIRMNRFIECQVALKDDENSTIFHNSFIGNARDAEGLVRSTWYETTSLEGNYYDDYSGIDDGSGDRRADDGIGDTNIPHNGRDPYPLMMDRYWDMPKIPELKTSYIFGSDTINLDWDQGGGKGFILQRSASPDFSLTPRTWSLHSPGISIPDNSNTTYYFRVRSYNTLGSRGWSLKKSVSVDQRPLHPKNIVSEPIPEGNGLMISWEWDGEDIYKALIYYGIPGDTPKLKETFYPISYIEVSDLDNGIELDIRLQTMDINGLYSQLSPSIFDRASDSVPPPPPRNLRGDATSNSTIVLNWNPPLIQDIGSYLLFRSREGESEMSLVTNLSKNTYSYEDNGLEDNTTYLYAMATVDDDGPVSEPGDPITVSTNHHNSRPYFVGKDLIIYLVEDEGPGSMDLTGLFRDDDGDELVLTVSETYPFPATIIGANLWISPHPDQSGEGYVEIRVSDGESAERYLIGVLVEPRPDVPGDVSILSPLNGSVVLPGTIVRLQGQAYDPDIDHGDMLNVTWTSDKDGLLYQNNQGKLNALAELRPGAHIITLNVEDRSGNVVERQVTVMVSLWGWGSDPWSVSFGPVLLLNDQDRSGFELQIDNLSPFVLRFYINGTFSGPEDASLDQRMVLIGPGTQGKVLLELPDGMDGSILVDLYITGETMNGTYAGSTKAVEKLEVKKGSDEENIDLLIPMVVVISLIVMIVLGIYLYYVSRGERDRDLPKID